MPLALVTLEDRNTIVKTVALHHVLLKCKAEMDQFAQGLCALGVLEAMKAHTSLFAEYFSADGLSSLVAGKFPYVVPDSGYHHPWA